MAPRDKDPDKRCLESDNRATPTARLPKTEPPRTAPLPKTRHPQTEQITPPTRRLLDTIFFNEFFEHLSALGETAQVLRFEGKLPPAELKTMLHRCHALKGTAATVGRDNVVLTVQKLENLLIALTVEHDTSTAVEKKLAGLLDSLVLQLGNVGPALLPDTSAQLSQPVALFESLPLSIYYLRCINQLRKRAETLHKEIDFHISDGNIWLCATLFTPFTDVLFQLLNNAVAHGIELPDERLAQKKNAIGQVRVAIKKTESTLSVEVQDDGAGVNTTELKHELLKKKLFTESALEKFSEQEIVEMVFLPLVSTARENSEIAGHGIGLDFVQKTVQELGGKISIHSRRGYGTSFFLYLPLNGSSTDL